MNKRFNALKKTEKRAFWITLLLGVLLVFFQTTLIDTYNSAPNWQYRFVNIVPALLAFITFFSALLIFIGQIQAGGWTAQLGIIFLLLLTVTQAEGFGFPVTFLILFVTLYIPVQILQKEETTNAFWLGVIGGITSIILDTFWTGSRVPALSDDTLSAGILSIVLSILLVFTAITQFNTYTLRTKLLILALGTGLISILSVAVSSTVTMQKSMTALTRENLVSAAQHTVEEIDVYIQYNIDQIQAEAQLSEIIQYLNKTPQAQITTRNTILELLETLAQRDPDSIGSYALLNADGIDIVDTYTDDIGVDKSSRDYFLQPKRTGRPYVSPVRFSPTSPDHAFYIGVPVKNENGRFIGVLRVRIRSSLLEKIIRGNNDFSGDKSYAILLDEFNVVLANGIDSSWVSHTLVEPDLATYTILQNENRISNIAREDLSLDIPTFSDEIRVLSASKPYFTSSDDAWGAPVEIGVAKSSTSAFFKVAFVQPQAIALAAVTNQQRIIIVAAIITSIVILFAGLFVLGTITNPIKELASVAEDISSGNLSARANYQIDDELGTLANSFNRMTSRLNDTLGDLERRVAERTADLDMSRLLSERRSQELQSISEISRAVSTEQRLELLLPLITRLVSERFNYYHIGIFFVDETHRFAYLQAANSTGGQVMLARGHRLEVGKGLVGTVAQTGKPRIALDVGSDAVFFDNPDLPKTRSEMALPLNYRGRTIGVLDVQSTNPGAFTENDTNTLGILADQVAVAIENARLFTQTQQARDEAEALYSQILRKEWGAFMKQETHVGYRQTATGGKALSLPVETEEINQAISKGQVVVLDGKGPKSQPVIAIPVRLRDQTIGVLNIKASTRNHKWNNDEINLAQAISDRLAIALDNARLLQESQRNAAKEALIGDISAKIGASINMRNVLQTAVEELGRALPGSEVIIQFSQEKK